MTLRIRAGLFMRQLKEKTWLFIFIFGLFWNIPASTLAQGKTIILATTTSTQDSGLLDVLIPIFEKKTGYFVKTIAVGSGQALVLGERGEVDLLLVHSPEEEKKFMSAGYGISRRGVMENDFWLLGPAEDPAELKGIKEAINAFQKIKSTSSLFISRGDNSGTHFKELSIWKAAKINPEGQKWYQQTGLGMGQTLTIASEKRGYTLADQGTYIPLKKNLNLKVFLAKNTALGNYYHVIEVNPNRWPKVNNKGARALADFLVGKEGQEIIRTFGHNQFGSPLFFPMAIPR